MQCLFWKSCATCFSSSGELDWRVLALTSPAVHLLILGVCFVLVYHDKWPSWHHRRIESLSHGARMNIKQVVEKSWDELLNCAKDLQDAKLEDGEKYFNDKEVGLGLRLPFIFVFKKPFLYI